jgi:hypothetical protein
MVDSVVGVEGSQPGRALHRWVELAGERGKTGQRQVVVVIEQRQVVAGGLRFGAVFGDFG